METTVQAPKRPWFKKKRFVLPLVGLLAVLTAWRSSAFWDALSPLTHKKELYRLGGVYKIDPLLLAAIIRAESHFYPFAESRAGAVGLMQLMPATAKEMAVELHVHYDNPKDLYREDVNLKLGTHYFSKMLKTFDGNLVLALAGYNAGLTKVRSWNLQSYASDQESLIDSIPINETKNYVRRVLDTYRALKAMQSVKRWLGGES